MSTARAGRHHESFDIAERKKILRQDRHDAEPGKCSLKFDTVTLEVQNLSYFGIAACIDKKKTSSRQLPREFTSAKLMFDGIEVQECHVKEVRQVDKANDWVEIAYEVIGGPVQIERIMGIETASQTVNAQVSSSKKYADVPEKFKRLVLEVKDWLENFKRRISEIDSKIEDEDRRSRLHFEDGFMTYLCKFLSETMPEMHTEIGKEVQDLSPEHYKACAEYFRHQLKNLIYDSPFSKRALEKPKGYAGDYEMMNHLYWNEFAGPSLFARVLHHYFINEPAGVAVKNRAYYLRDKITDVFKRNRDDQLRFLSIASGPARELQLFLQSDFEKGRKAEFNCLDQDEDSLKFAQRTIRSIDREINSGFNFRFIHKAIKNVISNGLEDSKYDLIYSAGLFDYLSDPVAQLASSRMFAALNPGGALIIGNFNLFNPTLPLMNLAWDWHLIYRSPEDLERLFSHLGGNVEVEQERLGINLFCVIRK